MGHSAIEIARKELLNAGLAQASSFVGCTEEEINSLERTFALCLPRCYREFLALMGRSAGEFMEGTDYSFPGLLVFRKDAERLLHSGQSEFRLATPAFVFAFHQGYTFLFFDSEINDPPVLMFTESAKKPTKISNSFSDWLLNAVQEDIADYKEYRDSSH